MEKDSTLSPEVEAAIIQAAEVINACVIPALDTLTRVVKEAGKVAGWALKNRPRLVHLSLHAKTARRRKKNRERIFEEYYKEGTYGKD